ncbi:hypothetical protein AVEN_227103-1, partial [Araneus ventricosus]
MNFRARIEKGEDIFLFLTCKKAEKTHVRSHAGNRKNNQNVAIEK